MELNDIRRQIDELDTELTRLFARRMDIVSAVAASKRSTGKAIRDDAREQAVLARVTGLAGEPYAPYVRELYRLIFELSRNYQSALLSEPLTPADSLAEACANPPASRR